MNTPQLITTLGIDFGEKRTGIAVAEFYIVDNSPKVIFSPITIVKYTSRQELIKRISAKIQKWQIKQIVIGVLPPRPDGKDRRITIMAQKLMRQINALHHLPYFTEDESYSSVNIENNNLISPDIDALSAELILKSFFRTNFLNPHPSKETCC